MRSSAVLLWLLGGLLNVLVAAVDTTDLRPLLSPTASIVNNTSGAPRWSDFDAPTPGAVVNVATENDVLVTVQYCITRNIPFLAQNGAHGWATTLHLEQSGLIINLAGLKNIDFNAAKTQVTLQGGALVSDVVTAAHANSALVATGTCNCVGMLGATLGGGVGDLMGLYGLGVDNFISLNVVTPSGDAIAVTPQDVDLWWALRGAGPNFGIVTSAVMKSYPVNATGLNAWMGPLTFTEDRLEALVQAVDSLYLQPQMSMSMTYLTSGAPDYTPFILLSVFYYGTEAQGKAAFAPIYAIGPAADETSVLPYGQWNAGQDSSCSKGERKPSYGAGLARMDPATWRSVWNEYKAFVQLPGTGNSAVLLNAYSMTTPRSIPDSSSSFPFRSLNFGAVAMTWYPDSSLDIEAAGFGEKCRDLWRSTSGLAENSTYINNGYGDETLTTVYGNNVDRLKAIKAVVDPHCRFNQWFPLSQCS